MNQINQPRIVTLKELRDKLVPMCHGDKWAETAIVDLWKKGAPMPQAAGEPERRVLIPEQFALWYADFQQRLGLSRQAVDQYSRMQNLFRTSTQSTRRRG